MQNFKLNNKRVLTSQYIYDLIYLANLLSQQQDNTLYLLSKLIVTTTVHFLFCYFFQFLFVFFYSLFFVLLLFLGSLCFLLQFIGFKLEWRFTLVSCTNNEVRNTEKERERVCSLCVYVCVVNCEVKLHYYFILFSKLMIFGFEIVSKFC